MAAAVNCLVMEPSRRLCAARPALFDHDQRGARCIGLEIRRDAGVDARAEIGLENMETPDAGYSLPLLALPEAWLEPRIQEP